MADTIIIGSRAHTAISIAAPLTDTDKPGLVPVGPSFVIHGANHPDAVNGMGVTRGVDAKVFRAWRKAHEDMQSPLAEHVFEVSEDDVKIAAPPVAPSLVNPKHQGWEPALQRMTTGENASLASKGSTVTHSGAVSSSEMDATSDTPGEDTPRSEPDGVRARRLQKSASATIAEELDKK